MPVVSAIFTEARALLNDTGASIFTDVALLPLLKKAYQELQDEMALNGLSDIKENDFIFNIDANVLGLTPPTDLIVPISVWEKNQNDPDTNYVEMVEYDWPPDIQQEEKLRFWRWNEENLEFPGATLAKTVKVTYVKFLTAIVDANSTIPVINCQTFLAARLAAIAAFSIGGNPDRAEIHNGDANIRLTKIINTLVKRQQNTPGRRQPYHPQQGR